MTWFGPKPCNCGCEPGTCECPDGGFSRSFAGTPTIRIEISGLPSTYSFEVWYDQSPFYYWASVVLNGLDQYNGTYLIPVPAVDGCISHPPGSGSGEIAIPAYSIDVTRRTLSGSSGCPVISTTSFTRSAIYNKLEWGRISGRFSVGLFSEMMHDPNLPGAMMYMIAGNQVMPCSLDYDPTLYESPEYLGTGSTGSHEYYPKDQKIYITYAADVLGRCVSPAEPRGIHQIGTIAAEIFDDV